MEEAFNKLQKEKKNDVDNLVKWMKDSKVIDESKEQTDKALNLFKDVPDKANVTLEKFIEVVKQLATSLDKSYDGFAKLLGDNGQNFLQTAMGAAGGALAGASNKLKGFMK